MRYKFKNANDIFNDGVSNVVEFRNEETDHSVDRIIKFTECLGMGVMRLYPEYGLTMDELLVIECAAAIHDIGKMAISESILRKPGKLTKEEMDTVKLHTVIGAELVRDLMYMQSNKNNNYCYDIIRHHHERYDGKGYPDGLIGEEISIGAQIVSIADVYDALIHDRPYKRAYTPQEAFDTIISGKCGTFSPKMLNVLRMVKKPMEDLAAFFECKEKLEKRRKTSHKVATVF